MKNKKDYYRVTIGRVIWQIVRVQSEKTMILSIFLPLLQRILQCFQFEADNISGKRLINSFVISVQRFKISCLTLVRKYSLMFLQSVGMDWVTSLRSQMKNGKVLSSPTRPSLERSLSRWENFIIKLRNVKKMFSFHLSRTIAFLSLLCSARYYFWAQTLAS